MVLTDGNGVTQHQRRYARVKQGRVNGVPKEMPRGCGIHIVTLNIRSGRTGGLETALCALRNGNIWIGVLQYTKLTGGIHVQRRPGYTVWETEAEIRHRGGISIVWSNAEEQGVEGVRNFGPNVISFIITLGRKKWYGVGAYVPPNDLPTTNWIRQALKCGTKGTGKMLVSNLNA